MQESSTCCYNRTEQVTDSKLAFANTCDGESELFKGGAWDVRNY